MGYNYDSLNDTHHAIVFHSLSNDTCVALIEKLKICTETTLHETKAYMRGWVGTSCYAPTINEAVLACVVKVTEGK